MKAAGLFTINNYPLPQQGGQIRNADKGTHYTSYAGKEKN